MPRRSFLGDMLTTLFDRRWVRPPGGDPRSLSEMCLSLLDTEGEVSGVTLAQAVLHTYAQASDAEKQAFFRFLNDALEIDTRQLEAALHAYKRSASVAEYRALARAAEPPRQEVLRRLNQAPGATLALVNMRADLLRLLPDQPDLGRTDLDFRHLLRSWFNRGFLMLRQISWDSPASILEKIVAYEAVHAIQDWDDLRRRLYPEDRRCFAFFHPSMPEEPLIFVEVALTQSVPGSIQRVLADGRQHRHAQDTKVAVFYSISNCQAGLKGISFGNLLIKQVVAELQHELPGLETFVTLSPIPRLMDWVRSVAPTPETTAMLAGTADAETVLAVAAHYLTHAKTGSGAPYDPVARFHLGNGAQIHAVHGGADLSDNGIRQSAGAMVNYEYDLTLIEQNHERFVQSGEVSTTSAFRSALAAATRKRKLPA